MNAHNTSPHCCLEMARHLEDDELHVTYLPKFREYGIDSKGSSSFQLIQFCPWCGSELPGSLRNEWFDEIDRQGLDEDGPLPKHLTTDEWWRAKKAS